MRKLATIRLISELRPIEGADRIETALVDGWEVVCKKGEFKVGDNIVYIEIDSIVPEREEFEFLRDRKFRVRTIKLRKQISQGLILPLSILPKGNYKLGDDVTAILGIKKYDPEGEKEAKLINIRERKVKNPLIKFMLRFNWFRKIYLKPKARKGGFPTWIVKTDEDRIQNKTAMFNIEKDLGTEFIVTEKLDGQSGTYYLKKNGKKYEFGVCSRNILLTKEDNSSYWTIARQLQIKDILMDLIGDADRIVLQGEILGDGIQGNKYKVNGYNFYAFNLIIGGKKIDTIEMEEILRDCGIKTVPILETHFKMKNSISEMVDYAKGNSVLLNRRREGVVIRSYIRNISFKVINPEFLLEEKD